VQPTVYNVTIQNFRFSPATLQIKAGDVVRWTNLDFSLHNAAGQTGPGTLIPNGLFNTGLLSFPESGQFTFTTPGTFSYYCQPHGSSMQASVVVRALLKPGDMNTDGAVNNLDIAPFVLALTNAPAYQAQYPGYDPAEGGDVNDDGDLNNLDIAPFVALLTGGTGAVPSSLAALVPEPASLATLALAPLALMRRRAANDKARG
jgi:plastocyanin